MQISRRIFLIGLISVVPLSYFGIQKLRKQKHPIPLPQGHYEAIILDIESGSSGTLLISYKVKNTDGRQTKWIHHLGGFLHE